MSGFSTSNKQIYLLLSRSCFVRARFGNTFQNNEHLPENCCQPFNKLHHDSLHLQFLLGYPPAYYSTTCLPIATKRVTFNVFYIHYFRVNQSEFSCTWKTPFYQITLIWTVSVPSKRKLWFYTAAGALHRQT